MLRIWHDCGGGRIRTRVNMEKILRVFEVNLGYSICRVAHVLGVSRYVVRRTLRGNGLHPYHYQRV